MAPGTSTRTHPSSQTLHLHILTFGLSHGPPHIPPSLPVLLHLNLLSLPAPPRHLLSRYTGASPILASAFFSIPGHESIYRDMRDELEDRLLETLSDAVHWRRGREGERERERRCVAVLVNCRGGMHRSVAVAERLAGMWRGGFLRGRGGRGGLG